MPYRLLYVGLGLLLVAAVAFGLAFTREGTGVDLPGPVEALSPQPGALVPPQTTLEIDMKVGYQVQIFVDEWPVTDATFVEATGVYRWTPSPTSPNIQQWVPGEHTVRIVWDTYTGLPDPGEFEWTFRVG